MRGEWIEIHSSFSAPSLILSLPMRGEWIEIVVYNLQSLTLCPSLPMRGEWIEICPLSQLSHQSPVSPHAGRVD